MSSPPPLSGIDLSSVSGPPPLSSIDLSGDGPAPGGAVQAVLHLYAQFFGAPALTGVIGGGVAFAPEFLGAQGIGGVLESGLGFSVQLLGEVFTVSGTVDAQLSFSATVAGYQDWTANLSAIELQEIYILTVTGGADGLPDIQVPISTWQATHQAAPRQNYLQASIPGGDNWIDALEARQNGQLVINKGFRFPDGTVRTEELLRSDFGDLRYDRGPGSYTLTVSGYQPGGPERSGQRSLSGVRSINMTGGRRRARCAIDLFLQPGMTVLGDGSEFRAEYINYYVSEADKFCEVSER